MSSRTKRIVARSPIQFSQDGNMVCATYHDFENLQESPAGFGETRRFAMMDLQQEAPLSCRKALWWGYGAPAGTCGEKAYGSDPTPYRPKTWTYPEQLSEISFNRQLARCPDHGGPTWEKAIALMLEEQ